MSRVDRNILKDVDLRSIPIIKPTKGLPENVAKDLGIDPAQYDYVGRLDVHLIRPKDLSVGMAVIDPMNIQNLTPDSLTDTLVSSIIAHLELICTITEADIQDVMTLVQNVADVAIASKGGAANQSHDGETAEDGNPNGPSQSDLPLID